MKCVSYISVSRSPRAVCLPKLLFEFRPSPAPSLFKSLPCAGDAALSLSTAEVLLALEFCFQWTDLLGGILKIRSILGEANVRVGSDNLAASC